MQKEISDPAELENNDYLRSYRKIVMYEDLNAASSIFGGTLVSWIDEAAAIFASCQMNARHILTKKISELVFNQPATLGDMLEIWCKVIKKGHSSLTVEAIVVRRTFADDQSRAHLDDVEICRCELVFVHVDSNGKAKAWN